MAYTVIGSDALAGLYMTGERGRAYLYLSPILADFLSQDSVVSGLVFVFLLEEATAPIVGLNDRVTVAHVQRKTVFCGSPSGGGRCQQRANIFSKATKK